MDKQTSTDPILDTLYGIYGFENGNDALKAQTILTKLNSQLTDEQLKQVHQLIKYAYHNGLTDERHIAINRLQDSQSQWL